MLEPTVLLRYRIRLMNSTCKYDEVDFGPAQLRVAIASIHCAFCNYSIS